MGGVENLLKGFSSPKSTITQNTAEGILEYLDEDRDEVIQSFCRKFDNEICTNPQCFRCVSRNLDIKRLFEVIKKKYPNATKEIDERIPDSRIGKKLYLSNGVMTKISVPLRADIYITHGYIPTQDKAFCQILFDSFLDQSKWPLTELTPVEQIDKKQWQVVARQQKRVTPVGPGTIVSYVPLPPNRTVEVLNELKNTKLGSDSDKPYREAKHKLLRRFIRRK